jgi:hypothetical protein
VTAVRVLMRGGGGPGGSKRTTTGSKRAARGRRMTNFDRLDAASSDRRQARQTAEKTSFKMKKPMGATDGSGRERRTLTLKIGSIYHVRNSNCIHMGTGGPNIYMYMKGKIYKESPEGIQ